MLLWKIAQFAAATTIVTGDLGPTWLWWVAVGWFIACGADFVATKHNI